MMNTYDGCLAKPLHALCYWTGQRKSLSPTGFVARYSLWADRKKLDGVVEIFLFKGPAESLTAAPIAGWMPLFRELDRLTGPRGSYRGAANAHYPRLALQDLAFAAESACQ